MIKESTRGVQFSDNGLMPIRSIVPADISARYEVHEWRNGLAILSAARPQEGKDILAVLRGFKLLRSDILKPGGRKSGIPDKLAGHFLNSAGRKKASIRALSWTKSSTS